MKGVSEQRVGRDERGEGKGAPPNAVPVAHLTRSSSSADKDWAEARMFARTHGVLVPFAWGPCQYSERE